MTARWLVVLVTAVALIGVPLAVEARPTSKSTLSAVELAGRIEGSGNAGWSGLVRSSGGLPVPDSDSFANLAQLLGENNELRVWWRSPEDRRIDRIHGTGETDLIRHGQTSVRWVFESETATVSPVSTVRLPDVSDLLPPTLGRTLLQGARPAELSRLPSRRVAGVAAPGVRLVPADQATSVTHVDVWAEPRTGLPLRVELYGSGDRHPALSTSMVDLELGAPPAETTAFDPPSSVTVHYDESVDVAAAANAFAPFDLPASLGGLPSRTGRDPGAVGVYGHGATTMIALPLRGRVAGPLRARLQTSTAAQETEVGTLAPVGPVGLLVTPERGDGGGFLLAGTVNAETLQRAAAQLLQSS